MNVPEPRLSNRPAREARRALALAWSVGFAMWGLLLSVGAVLPSIQTELGLSFTARSLVLALPFLSIAVSAVPGGWLADRRGIRRSVSLGGTIAVIGAGLRAVPGPLAVLLAAGTLFGVGLGLVIPNLPKLVSLRYGPRTAGLATGIYSTGLIGGSVCGIYVTTALASAAGSWRIALTAWTALGAVTVAGWGFLLPPEDRQQPVGRREYRRLLGQRRLWILAFLFAAGNASYFFLVGAYPEYLTTRNVPVNDAFGQLALLIGTGIPAIFVAPTLSDRAGVRRPFLWGPHALIAVLLFGVGSVPREALPLVSVGLGLAEMAIFSLALLLAVDLFPPDEVGRASGLVISIAYVGALLGPLGFGIAMDLTHSFTAILAAFALLSVASAIAVFALPETGGRGRRP